MGRPRYEGGGGDRNFCLSCLAPPGDSASGSRLSSKQGLFPSGSVPRSLFFEDNCCTHRACHPKFMLWDTVFMENEQAESLVSYSILVCVPRHPQPHAPCHDRVFVSWPAHSNLGSNFLSDLRRCALLIKPYCSLW